MRASEECVMHVGAEDVLPLPILGDVSDFFSFGQFLMLPESTCRWDGCMVVEGYSSSIFIIILTD